MSRKGKDKLVHDSEEAEPSGTAGWEEETTAGGKETGSAPCEETGVVSFSYSDLVEGTEDFRYENLIEDSFWWTVHRGILGGKICAVKRLNNALLRRDDREILEEVQKLHRRSHPNLINIIGYCHYQNKRFIVTELPSIPLASRLYDPTPEFQPLDWRARMMIALQVAIALNFLHKAAAVCKDLSTTTVLIGEDLHTKFHVWIAPTFYMPSAYECLSPSESYLPAADPYYNIEGYCPPEYIYPWTSKKDCYSFGILLLELITGKKACDHEFFDHLLIDRVRPIITNGRVDELVDHTLEGVDSTLQEAINLVLRCTAEDSKSRPVMTEVVQALDSIIGKIQVETG